MELELLLFMCAVMWCVGVRLTPLENNDKLQDITNLYVAEWQWESWPIKQELSEQEGRSPGLRKNVALWGDISKSAWYLFGGQPINGDPNKVYSDVWRFKVKTRTWKKFFPFQADAKSGYSNKKGKTTALRGGNSSDVSNASYFEPIPHGVILCGSLKKKNTTKIKNLNEWTSFKRKKTEEDKTEELSSLAIYAPKTPKSNTVWQIDVREKLWTTYVCCCDTGKSKNDTLNSSKPSTTKNKISNETAVKTIHSIKVLSEAKINNAEDEIDNEQQHLNISNLKSKKKKINQMKKMNEKSQLKKPDVEKRGYRRERRNTNETKPTHEEQSHAMEHKSTNDTETNATDKREENLQKPNNTSEKTSATEKPVAMATPKVAAKYCPEFSEGGTSVPVTWCDGRNEALVTADVASPDITVWIFNLTTSHWSQSQVKVSDEVEWPGCPNTDSIRYVGNDEEVYIICSPVSEKQTKTSNDSSRNSTIPYKIPSDFNTKLVFRINYKEGVLHSLGRIRLNSYFNLPEGEKVWRNDTQSILQIIRNSDNDTILILAFLDTVDLWILKKDPDEKESFDLIEKIWRGSALKWFDKYNAALYSLQFVSESGNSATILLQNPRKIEATEYWPRERGRFIIRVFRNENLKNQSFENRTREQNLTYELLLSDYRPTGVENQLNHMYNLKVLVFFGISLAIFTVFGFVVFLKKCVNCPPRIRVRNECHKSPLVIRYSVIPDDLLYPVA